MAEGERLVLTLTPEADYCVTKRAEEAWGYGSGGVRQSAGWAAAATAALQWNVTGGSPPYELEIDGQSADAAGEALRGASGRATVPCADTSVSWRWGTYIEEGVRYYDSDPQLDSGWHTIEAEVKDANGKKATATVRIYVLLSVDFGDDHLLRRGETYRVDGWLITAPDDYDVEQGGIAERECPTNLPAGERCEREYGFILAGVDAGVRLYESDYAEASRWHYRAAGADDSQGNAIEEALNDFSDSVGQPPKSNRGDE